MFNLRQLLNMGNCVCGLETLTINNRRFYVRNRLGEGGFSYVDLVEDARTHKDYALKRITCHSKEEERVAAQEVELMRRFKHPNIVPLEETANIKVSKYSKTLDILSEVLIVMPYYSRGSIQDHMEKLSKRSEKIPEDQIWTMFLGICQAVKEFHSQNPPYAHRDIKPANVMIADDGSPVLMDLGSASLARVEVSTAKISRQLQDEAAERCSMFYRAPELFNVEAGSIIDERTDIWSLGCLLYAMAFLESPFDKIFAQGGSIALATQSDNIKFPDSSGYSSAVHEMILRLMKVNVAERPFIDNVLETVEANYRKAQNQV